MAAKKIREVWTTNHNVGYHRWPEAHDERDYLRCRHRHTFCVNTAVRVGHQHRDVEFHDLHSLVQLWWDEGGSERGTQSCEQMCESLADWLLNRGYTPTRVTVSEDGCDGATVTYEVETPH